MSRNFNNLSVSQPCCLPTCPIPCSVICCTPPVSYPCMPYVPRIQYRIACRSQSAPKPTKAVIYLPSCPTSNPPKMEVTYLPSSSPPPSPCFYVSKTDCVPCILPCSKPTVMSPSSCKIFCPSAPSLLEKCLIDKSVTNNYATVCKDAS